MEPEAKIRGAAAGAVSREGIVGVWRSSDLEILNISRQKLKMQRTAKQRKKHQKPASSKLTPFTCNDVLSGTAQLQLHPPDAAGAVAGGTITTACIICMVCCKRAERRGDESRECLLGITAGCGPGSFALEPDRSFDHISHISGHFLSGLLRVDNLLCNNFNIVSV